MVKGSRQLLQVPVSHGTTHLTFAAKPLCSDWEGWGPLSSIRYDFTPCFLDVWILFTAGWGILLGVGALWYLLKRRVPSPVSKNWHFYTKLVRH